MTESIELLQAIEGHLREIALILRISYIVTGIVIIIHAILGIIIEVKKRWGG